MLLKKNVPTNSRPILLGALLFRKLLPDGGGFLLSGGVTFEEV